MGSFAEQQLKVFLTCDLYRY